MNEAVTPEASAEVLKKTFVALKKTQKQLQELEAARREPIAIIGMACRLPGGANDPEQLWQLLCQGRDTCIEFPADRWDAERFYHPSPDAPGMTHATRAHFLTVPIDGFDAPFFGISAKEAISLDPQQRILLEVTWDALENAGLDPAPLRGSRTSVYVGISSDDYVQAHRHSGRLELIDGYALTGTCFAPAAGRISYTLGLEGPSMAVDTACSSSLVAVHLACQSLRDGESEMAIAAGVNLILSPIFHIASSKLGTISPDGLCKTFDASANGYGRGEGCGVVVLKRLSDARANNDRILGLIRGSAVNQDGKSNGLTAPNGLAQEKVIKRALDNAGLAPADIGYIEVHGTGTSLGDPIEVESIGRIMAKARSFEDPVVLSTVKANIGHLEAAAGIAGLIKAVQCLRHEQIPPQIHLNNRSEHIPWDAFPFRVSTEATPWPAGAKPRRAGVSSFGFSGTNAHVILEEAPAPAPRPEMRDGDYHLLPLSARGPEALRMVVERAVAALGVTAPAPLADICHTAGIGRGAFPHRLAVVGASAADLAAALTQHLDGARPRSVTAGPSPAGHPRIAFLYTGQGSQSVGMGRSLYRDQPVFRETLDTCAAKLDGLLEKPLLELLYGPDADNDRLRQTGNAQPAIFAIEYALTCLWKSWGVVPDVVCGHSIGEYAAACAANVMDLDTALTMVALRGRLMQALPVGGAMTAVFAEEAEVAALVARDGGGKVAIAAINAPGDAVISGDAATVAALVATLEARGRTTQALRVSHAFHSPLMRPMVADFAHATALMPLRNATLPIVSTVTGRKAEAREFANPGYWSDQIEAPVRFADAVATLAADGVTVFLEIGPTPILTGLARQSANPDNHAFLSSLSRSDDNDRRQLLTAVAGLYVRGAEIDWAALSRPLAARKVALPAYPFQHKSYYLRPLPDSGASAGVAAGKGHPTLGHRIDSPALPRQHTLYQALFTAEQPSFLREHKIFGKIISPGAAHISMALSAARSITGGDLNTLEDVQFTAPLVLEEGEGEAKTVQMIIEGDENQSRVFRLVSRLAADADAVWQTHCSGRIATGRPAKPSQDRAPLAALTERCPGAMEHDAFYALIETAGYSTGPNFRCIRTIHKGADEAVCRLEATVRIEDAAIHPGLIDSILQTVLPACETSAAHMLTGDSVLIPLHMARVRVLGSLAGPLVCHTKVSTQTGLVKADIAAFTPEGAPVFEISDFLLKQTDRGTLYQELRPDDRSQIFIQDWRELEAATAEPAPTPEPATGWLVLAEADGWGGALTERLQARGARLLVVRPTESLEGLETRLAAWATPGGFAALQVVFAWNGADIGRDPDADAVEAEHRLVCGGLLHVAQALNHLGGDKPPTRLWLVTRQAQSVVREDRSIQPATLAGPSLWAFGRSISREFPELWGGMVDLGEQPSEAGLTALLSVFDRAPSDPASAEDHLAIRRGNRIFAARLIGAAGAAKSAAGTARRLPRAAEEEATFLDVGPRQTLDDLTFKIRPRRAPEAHEVEVAIVAAGLNFRDVLNALGQYPGDAGLLGFEAVGTVARVGSGVTGLAAGAAVIVLASPGCIGSSVTVDHRLVIPKPETMSFAEAVTLPATFLTAHYALNVLGKMRKGDRVLIHAAAGGVGLAAVQLAQRAGAEIFATAGSREKHEFLHALGVKHVMNSRTTAFAEEIKALTGGRGVDMVLNSLSGDFIPASFSVLAPHGRFLEMGKIGIWDEARVKATEPTWFYRPFDLAAVLKEDPDLIVAMFDTLLPEFAAGHLKPLPVSVFPIRYAEDAFRYMAQARHIGKIVLTRDEESRRELIQRRGPVSAEASYLVTGGLGALGLQVARWLAAEGAMSIVLTGRGEPKEAARAVIEELRQTGVTITTRQADVASPEDVNRLVAEITATLPPLKGVIHAAGLLDDGMVTDLSWPRFQKVMAPKVRGAWNLHRATRSLDLDLFVLFSSVAAIIGNLGQGNYAAANGFMDGLAAYRRRLNLAASSINWGPWAEAGMAAALDTDHFSSQGIRALKPDQGLRALKVVLREDLSQPCVAEVDWRTFATAHGLSARHGLFALLAAEPGQAGAAQTAEAATRDIRKELGEVLAVERPNLIRGYLHELARQTLGYGESEAIGFDQPLVAQGFDSLMSVDMRNRLNRSLGCALPASLLFDYPTLDKIADYLLAAVIKIADEPTAAALPAEPETIEDAEALLREIDDLVDA